MASDILVTRRQAELQWGISRSTLLRAEKTGLTPHRQGKGEVRYARHEVEALAAKMRRTAPPPDAAMDAESLASIFDLLGKRVSLADIVCQKRLHPDVVESIAARWRRMKEVQFVLTEGDVYALMDAIGFEEYPVVGTFAKLLDEIRRHQAGRGVSSPNVPSDHAASGPAATAPHAGTLPTLADLLTDLSEDERAVALGDASFVAFVAEQLADLETGELTREQALATIQRARATSLKRARAAAKKGGRRKRPRPASS